MQKLLKGENIINQAGAVLADAGYKDVFLVTGGHFLKEHDHAFLKKLNIRHYIKKGSNVEEEEVIDATDIFMQSGSQAILAIGGGSVLDLAKAIIYQLIESSAAIPFFVAAPTTAGSGSEATAFAVVYKGKKKFSLVHSSLLPKVVLLDPALTYSLSSYQTAVTGMDAFAQATESLWNRNATDESKKYAVHAVRLWKEWFLNVVINGSDKSGREKMLEAAHFAGKAINITRTTGPHALSYFLTANFKVPHGQAVALFLPAFFIYNSPDSELCSLLGVNDAVEAAGMIRQVMKEAGLAVSLTELGIYKDEVIDSILDEVNEERFANNPVAFDRYRLKKILADHI